MARSNRIRTLAVLLLALSLLSANARLEVEARRQPAKRSYETHAYYVLELAEGSSETQAGDLAHQLGAELVEQVGELRDHWLIRAEHHDLARRTLQDGHDPVINRYNALLHESSMDWRLPSTGNHRDLLSKLTSRSPPSASIVSLEKQIVKKRVKRQLLPVLPPGTVNGQPQAQSAAESVSAYLSNLAQRLSILDPLWPKQWHLANDQMRDNSINVTGVWEQGVTGKGVRVAIVDDGLDSTRWLC